MLEVRADDTPLDDKKAVARILDPLDMKYWQRRDALYVHVVHTWHDGAEVWLHANKKAGVLRRVIVRGIKEDEGKLLRAEFRRREARLTPEYIEGLATELVASREARVRQRTFEQCLRAVRSYFTWRNGAPVESAGGILPISKLLSKGDVELLRAVFQRLPVPVRDEATVQLEHDAPKQPRRRAAKTYGAHRKALDNATKQYASQVFHDWVDVRLKPAGWTQSAVLYKDFREFAKQHGSNRTEKRIARDTVLGVGKWGRLMGAAFTRGRHGPGKGYRVALRAARMRAPG